MNEESSLPFLVVIVGPTASGKSTLGVSLALQFHGEVVVCDSTQLYRGFDIGTAKLSIAERRGVPHHLVDVLDPLKEATAGGYRQLALGVLKDMRRRGRLPVFTVGTGLYLRALLEGLANVPQRSEELRERLRASAEEHRPGYLHRILQRVDPEAARKIAPADEQKLIRAVEVCLLARKPISQLHRAGRERLQGWRILKAGLMPPRERLHERIRARTESMLKRGWLREVESRVKNGLNEEVKPFDFIGYRELLAVLRGESSLEQARDRIEQATRRYAKRQLTWFRKESDVRWFSGFGDDADLRTAVVGWLQAQGLQAPREAIERGV